MANDPPRRPEPVATIVAHGALHGTRDWIDYNIHASAERRDNRALLAAYANSECRVVQAYESQDVGYKTWWGDQFGGGYRTVRLLKLHPDLIIYHNTLRHLEMDAGTVEEGQIDKWVREQKCVYLISSSSDRFPPEYLGFPASSLAVVAQTHHGGGSLTASRIIPPAEGASILAPRQ
jgi:hypothetical protein